MGKEIIDKHGSLAGGNSKTFDFITGDSLNNDDMGTIKKWSAYFKNKNIPYKVVKDGRSVKLIKKRYI